MEGFFTYERYSCFDIRDGVSCDHDPHLVKALKRMLLIDNEELNICSAKLLVDMHRVTCSTYMYTSTSTLYFRCNNYFSKVFVVLIFIFLLIMKV